MTELPEPAIHSGVTLTKAGRYKATVDGYTAEQMRAYGRAEFHNALFCNEAYTRAVISERDALRVENERLKDEAITWKVCYERMSDAAQDLDTMFNSMKAENERLRKVLVDIKYGLEGARIWGGMEWTYNPLHPFKYLHLLEAARAALGEQT